MSTSGWTCILSYSHVHADVDMAHDGHVDVPRVPLHPFAQPLGEPAQRRARVVLVEMDLNER